jgi:PIN domain nuclease of toxin-antitoxin system
MYFVGYRSISAEQYDYGKTIIVAKRCHGCARAVGLPESYPKDPADRIIAGTA